MSKSQFACLWEIIDRLHRFAVQQDAAPQHDQLKIYALIAHVSEDVGGAASTIVQTALEAL